MSESEVAMRTLSAHRPRRVRTSWAMSVAVKAAAMVVCMLQTAADTESKIPSGLNIPKLPAPRVSMDTINTMNRLAPPKPSPWPPAFSASFATNVTEKEWSAETPLPATAIAGQLWYDSTQFGQKVLHGAGSRECSKFYETEGACSLVFNKVGMYATIQDQRHCCLDMPGLFVPPTNWTLATHKFVGTQRIRGRMCHGFSYIPGSVQGLPGTFHEYWQDVITHLPCLFSFPGEERMTWVFDVSSIKIEQQDASMFVVPDVCSVPCSSSHKSTAATEQEEAAALWRALYDEEEGDLASVIDEVLQGLTAEQKSALAEQGRRKSVVGVAVGAPPAL